MKHRLLFVRVQHHNMMKLSLSLFLVLSLGSCSQRSNSMSSWTAFESGRVGERSLREERDFRLVQNDADWRVKVQQGDQAAAQNQWDRAVKFYNHALDMLDDPSLTPQAPSPSEIEEVQRRFAYAQILAMETNTRGSLPPCRNLMRSQVRGIEFNPLIPIEFEFDSVKLTQKGKHAAEKLVKCLDEISEERGNSRLTLIGHTDEKGAEEYNDLLSLRRAKVLKTLLQQKGVALSISTEGRGKREPVKVPPWDLTQTQIDQLNRRVEFNFE